DIRADRHEIVAPRDVTLRVVLDRRQDPGRLTDILQAARRVLDRLLHLGMELVPGVPERSGEIGGADEHAVHTRYRRDLLELVEGAARLDLYQHANLVIRRVQVILDAAVARRAVAA